MTKTCGDGHLPVTFETAGLDPCPVCVALEKIAKLEDQIGQLEGTNSHLMDKLQESAS